jgi:hypothetical protein
MGRYIVVHQTSYQPIYIFRGVIRDRGNHRMPREGKQMGRQDATFTTIRTYRAGIWSQSLILRAGLGSYPLPLSQGAVAATVSGSPPYTPGYRHE